MDILKILCRSTAVLVSVFVGTYVSMAETKTVEIVYDNASEQIGFAVGDLVNVLEKQAVRPYSGSCPEDPDGRILVCHKGSHILDSLVSMHGTMDVHAGGLGEQAFLITTEECSGKLCHIVVGGDETGAMYGVMELAERLYLDGWGKKYTVTQSPYIRYRGMKLNMPLDRRIPTYVGGWSSNSTKHAIPDVWDMGFWRELIDTQARARYNMLSVWVHHPFPALVRVPEYPDACLPDIEGFWGYSDDLGHEERVSFWREVMRYAHSRGMKFYFFNWNIYVDYAKDVYPEITREQDNQVTVDYTYRSMMALMDTYPELDGFGVSGGDGMASYSDVRGNSEWTYSVYGRAVLDYCREHPERKFNLIHRRLGTTPDIWNEIYSPLDSLENVTREFSCKYSQAHMYSTTSPQWSVYDIERLRQLGRKTWLTVRNDDYFYFDWGDHAFVREYIKNIPDKETVTGIYIGSDGYTPARAYLCKDEDLKKMTDVQRRWYMETLWGRISYDPDIDNSTLAGLIGMRYPQADAMELFEAWTLASRSLPRVTELVVNDWDLDFEWYPEACSSDPGRCTGFRTIDDFAHLASPAKGSCLCGIIDSAEGRTDGRVSTYDLADTMRQDAEAAIRLLDGIRSHGNKELDFKIANIRQMAYLSMYYSYKIKGATFRYAGDTVAARDELGHACDYWRLYTALMEEYYIPDSFRNIEISPDWHFADKDVMQEYLSLDECSCPAR